MEARELGWLLVHYDNNLDVAEGLQINTEGELVENIGTLECKVEGLFCDVIKHQGCEGMVVIDYKHKYA